MPQPAARKRKANEKVLRPIHANAGIEALYRKRLDALIAEMQKSVVYFVKAAYRASPPRMAADGQVLAMDWTPADALKRAIAALAKRWTRRIEETAPKLAEWFAQSTDQRSKEALKRILKDGGIAIEFKQTPAMKDIVAATVNQNVALIKSIPQQYFSDIEGMVMRSVQRGQDIGGLTKELEARYGVTRRRAALIANTQNNMATASMAKARALEAGIDEAVWVHSHGGREPRPTHLKAGQDKTRYKIAEGWYDPHEKRHIQPGELVNCRCFARPVVKGFE